MTVESDARERWLRPTFFIDHDQPAVRSYAKDVCAGLTADRDKAVALFYAVRDDFRYDPYRIDYSPAGFTASNVLQKGYGFCLPKATLLAAAARATGIPARLGYGDVRNHLTSEKLRQSMRSDLFVFHGYAQLLIDGRWVKATPAFNREMCDRFGVKPLEFDGVEDSLFHEFDSTGQRHMEYVRDRGIFDDVPYDTIIAAWHEAFPGMIARAEGADEGESRQVPAHFAPNN